MKNLTFISWNVNGIRAVDKKDALKWSNNKDYKELHVNSSSKKRSVWCCPF
jgi:exodeoxyribonuclease-3